MLADTDNQIEDDSISAVDRLLKTILPYLTKK
jgi:hypothetical protein